MNKQEFLQALEQGKRVFAAQVVCGDIQCEEYEKLGYEYDKIDGRYVRCMTIKQVGDTSPIYYRAWDFKEDEGFSFDKKEAREISWENYEESWKDYEDEEY